MPNRLIQEEVERVSTWANYYSLQFRPPKSKSESNLVVARTYGDTQSVLHLERNKRV